jgi:hypothetical protein
VITLFAGYDEREAVGFHVFVNSVIARASVPVQIVPLAAMGLPQGSNAFTLSRFLIPYLMDFKGRAIFADASDMLMLGDVAELDALFDPAFAAQVVKHAPYNTKHKIKYRGTGMECPNLDYPRKNWASLMLINCEHPGWFGFRPETMPDNPLPFLKFEHFRDEEIGDLPNEWNRLADEGHPVDGGKLLHWTAGVPGFPHYRDAPGADQWHAARKRMEEVA